MVKKTILVITAAVATVTVLYAGGRREQPSTMGPAMEAMPAAEPMSGAELRMAEAPNKVQFTSLEDAQALAAMGPTVLFFSADWCPTCQAALRDINANATMLDGIRLVVVDYDNAGDLKTRYGVTYQHTFVRIDAAGVSTDTWSGGGVAEIVARVKGM